MGFFNCALADKLKKKSRNVIVFGTGNVCAKNLIRSESKKLGTVGIEDLIEFLNKFGRRLILYELTKYIFGEDKSKIWEIDFRLLQTGHWLFEQNRNKFKEAVKKAGNKREFLWMAGLD